MFLGSGVVTVLVMTNHKATFDIYGELLEDPRLLIEQLESFTELLGRLNGKVRLSTSDGEINERTHSQ